jgi:diaminohydroxyphosphoribosylaminopyrimidine deaminase/5-amino-6-(5-phosphoribosylamino)uracil reductase
LTDENPTWIFTKRVSKVEGNKIWFASQTKNADAFLSFVLQTLYQKNIHSILVEGGAATLQHFLDNQFVDEIIQIEYSKEIGEGITAPLINEQWKDIRKVGDDNLWKYWYRD